MPPPKAGAYVAAFDFLTGYGRAHGSTDEKVMGMFVWWAEGSIRSDAAGAGGGFGLGEC